MSIYDDYEVLEQIFMVTKDEYDELVRWLDENVLDNRISLNYNENFRGRLSLTHTELMEKLNESNSGH